MFGGRSLRACCQKAQFREQQNGLIMTSPPDTPPTPTRRQIPAIGTIPDAETLFVGALMWSLPDDAAHVLTHVSDDDLGNPTLRLIVAAIRELVSARGSYTPAVVLDRLERRDGPRTGVLNVLNDCLTSGAASCPEALRDYAAAVVSASLRRSLESGGHALRVAADRAAERELAAVATMAASASLDIASRLEALRGESL